MSVIAKLRITNTINFGAGTLVELSCVCENDLMAAYAESEEDRLFTKYSPWGEIKLHQPDGWKLGNEGDTFYVMIVKDDEQGNKAFPGAFAWCPARVSSITDFGDGMAKRLDIADSRRLPGHPGHVTALNWKMSVDNPGATNQLLPGRDDYYVAFYPAASFNRDQTIGAAHS